MSFFSQNLRKLIRKLPVSHESGKACSLDPCLHALASCAEVIRGGKNSCLIIADSSAHAERLHLELSAWLKLMGEERSVHLLPELELTKRQLVPEHECERSRLFNLTQEPDQVFVASVAAVLTDTPAPQAFRSAHLRLEKGMLEWPPQKLAQYLTDLDYDNEIEVHLPGEFSWRGGILDVFSPAHEYPVRLDYFGDELDSIRFFEPETQRSRGEADGCLLIPRGEAALRDGDRSFCFIDYFKSANLSVIYSQPELIADHLDKYGEENWANRYQLLGDGRYRTLLLADFPEVQEALPPMHPLGELFATVGNETDEAAELLRKQFLQQTIKRWTDQGMSLGIACSSRSKLDRVAEYLSEIPELAALDMPMLVSEIPCGVLAPGDGFVILSEAEIFGISKAPPRRSKRPAFHADHMLHGGSDLQEGQFAVHALYGICRYQGLGMATFNNQEQEVLILEFADDVEVFVPLEQAHLVCRYMGSGKKLPRLSKIGHTRWKKVKGEAELAVKDLAAELLRLQAVRSTSKGYSFLGDETTLDSFADAFPHQETADQATACEDIFQDMKMLKPMDRLLCGDVGFGKTEVAMRAAFKAVLAGKQVAVLVPTTVLCQQHCITFRERFKEFPVLIESLSRFQSGREQRATLLALEEGRVDIVIGTHRLLSDDIRFKDLGLMVIDEEQRFGVQAKEKLKQMRMNVDVLTMTATPIPRTLYLSMSGLRDMSTIITPPLERLPVQTIVAEYSPDLVREVILRELQRDGQVFVLHNRVKTIRDFAKSIRQLVPEAKVDVGHGQMEENDLEQVMLRFMEGETNVLVSTTIIESGLDIPNANTIIIDRADRFGLAELYQLRGRVGRYHRQAYAYLLIPPHAMLITSARERLAAIRKYTQLGAGFKLALRDLEIRGAGNILGREQSGHIAAIGFELYCQLLREAVSRMQGEVEQKRKDVRLLADFVSFGAKAGKGKIAACLPKDYIHDESVRVSCYRQLSAFTELRQTEAYAEELRDRFGVLPQQAIAFLTVTRLKILAASHNIHTISVRDGKVFLERGDGFLREGRKVPTLRSTRVDDYLGEIMEIINRVV